MTIKHIVLWKLAATDETEKNAAFTEIRSALTGLVGRVPSIRSLRVERNGAYPESNSDVVLEAEFDDYAGLDDYQVHPEHQAAAAIVRQFAAARSAVDYEF